MSTHVVDQPISQQHSAYFLQITNGKDKINYLHYKKLGGIQDINVLKALSEELDRIWFSSQLMPSIISKTNAQFHVAFSELANRYTGLKLLSGGGEWKALVSNQLGCIFAFYKFILDSRNIISANTTPELINEETNKIRGVLELLDKYN